ncbi:hypothetical protein P20495_2003 [Pseudoalteromonas sp. BSi20495]|nr:hypothetical protein P20495_2003 [Pseudoalteromonas sp. BSi20495]
MIFVYSRCEQVNVICWPQFKLSNISNVDFIANISDTYRIVQFALVNVREKK